MMREVGVKKNTEEVSRITLQPDLFESLEPFPLRLIHVTMGERACEVRVSLLIMN